MEIIIFISSIFFDFLCNSNSIYINSFFLIPIVQESYKTTYNSFFLIQVIKQLYDRKNSKMWSGNR